MRKIEKKKDNEFNNARNVENSKFKENFNEGNNQKPILSRNKYSCNLLKPNNIYEVKQFTKNIDIKCKIINNGKSPWIKGKTKLLLQENEYYTSDDITLDPLEPEEQQKFKLYLREKQKVKKGEYSLKFDLIVDNNKSEEPIVIKIKIN